MIKTLLRKLFWGGLRHILTDKQYAVYRYWLELDRLPDIENPTRFTEKIQHIKLFQRTNLRKLAANRFRVRSYVAEKIGENHLIPLLGNFDEITPQIWSDLPRAFVLKANHGCKMNLIVTDKETESFDRVQALSRKWKQTDYYKFGREWVYKELPRTIVVEELIRESSGEIPNDFKFFCFHGKVEMVQVDFDRFGKHRRNLYDRNFKLLPVRLVHRNYKGTFEEPSQFKQALNIAEELSSEFDFIRVDLYLVNEKVYFGELTNYPANGFQPFTPDDYDITFGRKWHLNTN